MLLQPLLQVCRGETAMFLELSRRQACVGAAQNLSEVCVLLLYVVHIHPYVGGGDLVGGRVDPSHSGQAHCSL